MSQFPQNSASEGSQSMQLSIDNNPNQMASVQINPTEQKPSTFFDYFLHGINLQQDNKLELAEQKFRLARKQFQNNHGTSLKDMPEYKLVLYLNIIKHLSPIYQDLQCEFDALCSYKLQATIQQKITGRNSLEVARILNKIGYLQSQRPNYSQALQYLKESQEIYSMLEDCKAEKADLFTNIAKVNRQINKQQQALEYYLRSLQLHQQIEKSTNKQISILNSIGLIYKGMGKFTEAFEYFTSCLSLQQVEYGKQSIDSAAIFYNIGSVYQSQRNYPLALENYQQCLFIEQTRKQKGCLSTASTLSNMGVVYRNQGNFPMALETFYKCLDIQNKFKGERSTESAQTLNNIGQVYRNLQAYYKCLQFQESANNGFKNNPSQLAQAMQKIYRNQISFSKAIEYYLRAVSIYEELKIRSKGYSIVLFNLGGAYYHLKDFHSAANYMEQSLKIYNELQIKRQAGSCAFALAKCLIELYQFQRVQSIIQQYQLNASQLQQI